MKAVRFSGIHKRFGDREILSDAKIVVQPGECQLLCGKNGAGKSTLLRILAGMEKPQSCVVTVDGSVSRWARVRKRLLKDFIYMHQSPYLFEGSVAHNLAYPVRGTRAQRAESVADALKWSGLAPLAMQSVDNLSGGERQRVALARAWLRRPRVMLLDEPTSNMDTDCRVQTLNLLESLKGEGVALIVATHDARHFGPISDRVLFLEQGRLQSRAADCVVFPKRVVTPTRSSRVSA